MSKLYSEINADASRSTVTRRAHRNVSAHLRGWHDGCEVFVQCDDAGRVQVEVWRTAGSAGVGRRSLVASWTEGEPVTIHTNRSESAA